MVCDHGKPAGYQFAWRIWNPNGFIALSMKTRRNVIQSTCGIRVSDVVFGDSDVMMSWPEARAGEGEVAI
jgi:hypothetical protein